jgi:Uncharacterized protein conserved in bacteria, putative lipoprotein
MEKIKHCFIVIVLLIFSVNSYGASFNCAKANTWPEKVICSNHQLSNLDDLLVSSYKKALSSTSHKESLKAAQKKWLESIRNACQNTACLKSDYSSRIAELNDFVAATPKRFSFSGKYERYYKGKPDKDSAIITVRELAEGQIYVEGVAEWVGNANTGNVNLGELEGGLFPLEGKNVIHYKDGGCKATITFSQNALIVSNDNLYCDGLNVTFDGQYIKVGKDN